MEVLSLTVWARLRHKARLYGRSRQCSRPVGARWSMGLGRNQLINGLIQHTFKLNILFLQKYTVISFDSTKLFPVDHKSPWCFRKKIFWNQKNWSEIFYWGPTRQSRQAKKKSSSWKIIEVTHLRRYDHGGGSGVIIILLKLVFFKIPDLVHRRTSAPVATGNCCWMALQTS